MGILAVKIVNIEQILIFLIFPAPAENVFNGKNYLRKIDSLHTLIIDWEGNFH